MEMYLGKIKETMILVNREIPCAPIVQNESFMKFVNILI